MKRSTAIKALLTYCAAVSTLLISPNALAVHECGGVEDTCICGLANPFPCCDNGGNCTWYAFHRACCDWGVAVPMRGNANTWAGVARNDPAYEVIGYPVVQSIGCLETGAYGHVAWVTAVNGSTITIHEQNCWGNYGVKIRDTNQSSFTSYIIRQGQLCDCKEGETQSQNCGDCGTQTRTCGSNCKWGDWGACAGTIAPDACETGQQGACARGTLSCENGNKKCNQTVQPTDEVCDGIDNNCNGQVDEGDVCAPPRPVDSGTDASQEAAADTGTDGSIVKPVDSGRDVQRSDSGKDAQSERDPYWDENGADDSGGCACSTSSRANVTNGWLLIAAAAVLATRRSARKRQKIS